MTKRVIELIRVSTELQADDDRFSIPSQRAVNRRTAQVYDLRIVRSIEYSDVSGAAVLASPEVQELMRAITAPEIHGVVAREFSRLMRPEDLSDYALLQHFANTKTLLYLDGQPPIDFNNKMGRFWGTLQAAMAGLQRAEFLEQTWNAKEEMRRRGKHPNGYCGIPYGVSYDGEWRYTDSSERVREAFRLVLSGERSYRQLSRQTGINENTLKGVLRNPIYAGWRVIDHKRDIAAAARRTKEGGRQGDRPKIKRSPEEVIRVRVFQEPLVSESDFARCQEILGVHRRLHVRRAAERFTYHGFLTCSCGEGYTTKTKGDGLAYYACKGRYFKRVCQASFMRREVLESRLDALFASRLTDRGYLREMAREVGKRAQAGDRGRERRLLSEVETLRQKRERTVDTYVSGMISAGERDSRLKQIDRDLRSAESLLERERPEPKVSARDLARLFSPFSEFEFLQRRDKRKLLASLAAEVRISNYKVEHLRCAFSAPCTADAGSATLYLPVSVDLMQISV